MNGILFACSWFSNVHLIYPCGIIRAIRWNCKIILLLGNIKVAVLIRGNSLIIAFLDGAIFWRMVNFFQLVRVIANMSMNPVVGSHLSTQATQNSQLTTLLKNLVSRTSGPVLLAALGCLNNLTYYVQTPTSLLDLTQGLYLVNIALHHLSVHFFDWSGHCWLTRTFGRNLSEILILPTSVGAGWWSELPVLNSFIHTKLFSGVLSVLADKNAIPSQDCAVEACRVLGNLTRHKRTRDLIFSEGGKSKISKT